MNKLLSPLLFFASTMSILAQGVLTPPGAPAATMRTLLQIEPRTPSYATNCIGLSTNGLGLAADFVAKGCYGKTAGRNVYGIQAPVTIDCYGEYNGTSASAFAINSSQMSTNSWGVNTLSANRGILTSQANSCTGSVTTPNWFDMPPP
jgi:hypothetical protein